jgi:hypothetical protein
MEELLAADRIELRVVPLRVKDFRPPDPWRKWMYEDLFALDEYQARTVLLGAAAGAVDALFPGPMSPPDERVSLARAEEADARPKRSDTHLWPAGYHGQVWINVRADRANTGSVHRMTIHWGPWKREVVDVVPDRGLYLTFEKQGETVSVPCHIEVDLPSYLRFGMGDTGDRTTLDIADDWTQDSSP